MTIRSLRYVRGLVLSAFGIGMVIVCGQAWAAQWSEMGDAGDVPGSAQVTSGPGNLDTISGTLTNGEEADLYQIFIENAQLFSATTIGGDSETPGFDFDAQLALFDAEGIGVYYNDDRSVGDGDAALPAAHPLGPVGSGIYYLAIADVEYQALGGTASSIDDLIFPALSFSFPWTQIWGSTGPGGATPLAGWGTNAPNIFSNAGYQILLTGARFSLDTTPPDNSLVSAVLPASRSVQVGDPATAFATIINTGTIGATDCGIAPLSVVPADFTYNTADVNNLPDGPADTPASISAGGQQQYVFAFTPTAPFDSTDVQFTFDCTDSDPAPNTVGLNTLLLVADSNPVPDIVALGATTSNDGIVVLSPNGAFSVATVNVGVSGTITATADTSGVTLPITITSCQTDPGSGVCINPVTPSTAPVTVTIGANETPTFSVFVSSFGGVPTDLANNRIFVRFEDASGVPRGATSVAVRSQ